MSRFFPRFFAGIVVILALVFSAADLWAAGAGFTGEVFWQIVSFVLLVVLLFYVLKKPLRGFLLKRREEIRSSLEQCAQREEASKTQYAEWERKLGLMDQEIAELHKKISQEGEVERKKIVERAFEESQRIKEQAQVITEQEVKKARETLKKEMADMSIELAEKLLRESMQPRDQERLVKEYIGKIRELR